ncbi:MAG TPA: hypothetical protein DGG94_21370 [Micromonosporaceae bacterium]|nr:hypothetical protein [Micromonosporaceae bacterium]HCU52310.1 hypothetical protein [Micromonosporaceae bacterium]
MATFSRYRTVPGAATLVALILVLAFGSPAYVRWVQSNTDENSAGGWFMRLLAWPAWRFDDDESVQNLIADDIKAILVVAFTFLMMQVAATGTVGGRLLAGWAAYIFAAALAGLLAAFVQIGPTLLTAFQNAGGGAIYGLFVGWIVGAAALGGYRGTPP